MGNYKFKLSDLIPNSLFYKLKHMNIGRRNQKKEPSSSTSPTQPHPILLQYSHRRKSHHFTRQLAAGNSDPAEPPRKSSKGKPSRPRTAARTTSPRLLVAASSSGCTCARVDQSVTAGPSPPALLTQYSFHAHEEDSNAIIFQKGHKITPKKMNGPDGESKSSMTQIDLPPIITTSSSSSSKPEETIAPDASTCPSLTIAKNNKSSAKEPSSSSSSPSRRFPVNSPRPSKVRIMNSSRPSVSSKRFAGHHSGRRKSGSPAAWKRISLTHSSLAIVKSTNDPQRDFRESMVEMIVENKISGSNELEDLLACYLSLNTHEYHDIIIKVFKQIWFDITDIIENAN